VAQVTIPTEIVVHVCPECGWWARWAGNCDALCGHAATERFTYALVEQPEGDDGTDDEGSA